MDTLSPTKRHLRSWQRRKQARPGEILDAALAVFAERGFAAARMEDIAVRAGVTKGTIYLYFPSKEEVFKSLARQHITETLAVAAEQAKDFGGSAFEFLKLFFERFAQTILTSDAAVLPKIIISEAGNFPELATFWRKEVIDKAMGMLTGILAKGIERGEIRAVDPEYVARLCVAPALLCLIWRTTFAHTEELPFDYKAFLALHREILVRGLTPEKTVP